MAVPLHSNVMYTPSSLTPSSQHTPVVVPLASNSLYTPSVNDNQYVSLGSASYIEIDTHHDNGMFNQMYGALSSHQTDSTIYAVPLEDSSIPSEVSSTTITRDTTGHTIVGDYAVPLAFSES